MIKKILNDALAELNKSEAGFFNEGIADTNTTYGGNIRKHKSLCAHVKKLKDMGLPPSHPLRVNAELAKDNAYHALEQKRKNFPNEVESAKQISNTMHEEISLDDIISECLGTEFDDSLTSALLNIDYYRYLNPLNEQAKANKIIKQMSSHSISSSVIDDDNGLRKYIKVSDYKDTNKTKPEGKTITYIDNGIDKPKLKIDVLESLLNDEISIDTAIENLPTELTNNGTEIGIKLLTNDQLNNHLNDIKCKVIKLVPEPEIKTLINGLNINNIDKTNKRIMLIKLVGNNNDKIKSLYDAKKKQLLDKNSTNNDMYYNQGITKYDIINILNNSIKNVLSNTPVKYDMINTFVNADENINEAFGNMYLQQKYKISPNLKYKYDIKDRDAIADKSLHINNVKDIVFEGQVGQLLKYLLTGEYEPDFAEYAKIADIIKDRANVKSIIFTVKSELYKQQPDINKINKQKYRLRSIFNNIK